MMEDFYGIIYMIRNKINNKIYFGQTVQDGGFKKRYSGNVFQNTHNKHLKNAFIKYGKDNFVIVEEFDKAKTEEELNALEDMYIKIYDTTNPQYGYNKKMGGLNGLFNEETKRKMSESQMGEKNHFFGKIHSEETKQHLKNVWKPRERSEEAKKRFSENQRGERNPMHGLQPHETPSARKVVCVNTGEVFDCLLYAMRYAKLKSTKTIIKTCRGVNKTAGRHPDTGEKLKWMYYEDYLLRFNLKGRC